MKVLRAIAGVVIGYVLFAVGSMLNLSLLAAGEGWGVVGLTLAILAAIGLVAGLSVSKISGEQRVAGLIVAALVVLATVANLVLQLGVEPGWYKIGTLALTVPGILGVVLRRRS